jgi:hypothetical protein
MTIENIGFQSIPSFAAVTSSVFPQSDSGVLSPGSDVNIDFQGDGPFITTGGEVVYPVRFPEFLSVPQSSLAPNLTGAAVDLILDFDGGFVQNAQGYTTPPIPGNNFTAFAPFDQSDGTPGNLNEQILHVVAGVREDFADFNVNVIWDDRGVNSPFFDGTDTVIMIVDDFIAFGLFGIAGSVDVPAFTSEPTIQALQDLGFSFASAMAGFFSPDNNRELRELIDTTSHEAGHTFGLSHTSQLDQDGRQLVTNVGQNRLLDSRFSPQVLNHDGPEPGVFYAETDRLNLAVGAAAVLPGDTVSSQALPQNGPDSLTANIGTPFIGQASNTNFLTETNTVNFLGDRDAFRFTVGTTGRYRLTEDDFGGSTLVPAVTLWDENGDFVAAGNVGATSVIAFDAIAGETYYAIAGSDVDRQTSGVIPTGNIGDYELNIVTTSAGVFGLGRQLLGSPGDDTIVADPGNNIIFGNFGDDKIFGDAGTDNIFGGFGDDLLNGEAGNDFLDGELGDDTLDGAGATLGVGEIDRLAGGAGSDLFILGNEVDAFYQGFNDLDFAYIVDFNPNVDTLQLNGAAIDYTTQQTSVLFNNLNITGQGIFQGGDLVAILQQSAAVLGAQIFV